MSFFLGVDIGTTNVKSIIFDCRWAEVFSVSAPVSTLHPENGFSEQDPDEIVRATELLLEKSLDFAYASNIKISAIGLSAAMHSFMAVDTAFKPLTRVIIWSDTRAGDYVMDAKKDPGVQACRNSLNVPLHPMLPVAKWMWSRDHLKDEIHMVLSLKDYLLWHWFGRCVTDVSIASSTGYFDVFRLAWHKELLASLNLPLDKLPGVVPATEVMTDWTMASRKKFEKHELPPVVVGASDGCLANLAAGIADNTTASLTIGTSGAVRTMSAHPANGGSGLFSYPVLEDYYVTGGATNNGGNVLQWMQNGFGLNENTFWADLDRIIAGAFPTNDQLIFIPYIFGERAPIWEADVRGAYLGVSHMHGISDFLLAAVEGVAFSLKHILLKLNGQGCSIGRIIADGGFTKSDAWVQLVCNVLGVNIEVPATSFGAARGAAMVARIALTGESVKDITTFAEVGKAFFPEREKTAAYDVLFQKYLQGSGFMVDHCR